MAAEWTRGCAGNPPGQGPFLHVLLRVVDGSISEASYETYQCVGCVACGKAIITLVTGKTVEQARALRYSDVVEQVGPLPRHRQVCYGLAIVALADALKQVS